MEVAMPYPPGPGGVPKEMPDYVQMVREQRPDNPEQFTGVNYETGKFDTGPLDDPTGVADQSVVSGPGGTPAQPNRDGGGTRHNPYPGMPM